MSALVAIIEPSPAHVPLDGSDSLLFLRGWSCRICGKKRYALRSERHASQSHNSQVFGCFVNKQFELNVLEEKELYTVT